jgi:hypothetical protein
MPCHELHYTIAESLFIRAFSSDGSAHFCYAVNLMHDLETERSFKHAMIYGMMRQKFFKCAMVRSCRIRNRQPGL